VELCDFVSNNVFFVKKSVDRTTFQCKRGADTYVLLTDRELEAARTHMHANSSFGRDWLLGPA
jgi:hypothetical protein